MRKLILILLLFPLTDLFSQNKVTGFFSQTDDRQLVEKLVSEMTPEEKIGQVLMLGFMGDMPSDVIMKWVVDRHLGSVKIFGWNADNLSHLTHTISVMQKAALNSRLSIPLLIATDQEGGWVRHIRGDTSVTAGNMSLGAEDYLYDSWKTGYLIGLELHALGVNMNFAPVVDIYLNPKATVIGPRAFSDNPVDTSILGLGIYKGLNAAGIISTAKHFPGHGDTDKDSHGTLPELNISLDELKKVDLLPYRVLISDGIPAIMVGHLAFPLITKKNEPASLSHYFLTDLLRDQMNFHGLIISDDLFMHGARTDGKPLGEICEEGLRAGLDLLLISRNPEQHELIWRHLIAVMKKDPEFVKMVDRSVSQVLRLKLKYLKGKNAVPFDPESADFEKSIPAPGAKDFFQQQALRCVSLMKDKDIPIPTDGKYLLAGTYTSFFYEGRERFPHSDFHHFSYDPTSAEATETADYLKKIAGNYDRIIFNLHNRDSLGILKKLEPLKDKLIVFSVLTPVYLSEVPWVKSSIAVYGTGDDSFRAGFSALAGDYKPDGKVPLHLEGLTD